MYTGTVFSGDIFYTNFVYTKLFSSCMWSRTKIFASFTPKCLPFYTKIFASFTPKFLPFYTQIFASFRPFLYQKFCYFLHQIFFYTKFFFTPKFLLWFFGPNLVYKFSLSKEQASYNNLLFFLASGFIMFCQTICHCRKCIIWTSKKIDHL